MLGLQEKIVEGSGDMKVRDHDHFSDPILSRGNNFRVLVYQSCNVDVRQQYLLQIYTHNSKFYLKLILLASARLKKGEVVDGTLVDRFFLVTSYPSHR